MGAIIDLTGQVFGRLTVIRQVEDCVRANGKHMPQWLCECSCSNHTKKIVSGRNLRNGKTNVLQRVVPYLHIN